MSSALRFALVFAAAVPAAAAPASAPTLLGVTQSWSAYQATTPDGKVCYALTKPTAILPVKVSRDPIYFLVSVWADRNVPPEVEVFPGYTYKDGVAVTAQVGSVSAEFFSRNDGKVGTAWAKNADEEAALLKAMRGGSRLTVIGTSKRGTKTTDTYSLSGFTAALDAAKAACAK